MQVKISARILEDWKLHCGEAERFSFLARVLELLLHCEASVRFEPVWRNSTGISSPTTPPPPLHFYNQPAVQQISQNALIDLPLSLKVQ